MHLLLHRDPGPSGSVASSSSFSSSSLLTSLATLAPSATSTNPSPSSSTASSSTPIGYIAPPPDPSPNHVVAYTTVASVIFFFGVLGAIWYIIRARALRKRNAREAKMSTKAKDAAIARRRIRSERPLKEKLGDLWGGGGGR